MRGAGFVVAAASMLSLLGAVVSLKLLRVHVTGSSGSAWFDAGCGEAGGWTGADCTAVLASPYSYIPPKTADAPPGRAHLPAAFAGMVYFSVLLIWLLGVGRPSPARRWVHLMPLCIVAAGLLASAYFSYVMFRRLDAWCPWCAATHLLNLALAICIVVMWPRHRLKKPASAPPRERPDTPREGVTHEQAATVIPAHPSGRLLVMTCVAILLVVFGQFQLLMKASYARAAGVHKQDLDQCMAVVEQIRSDADALVRMWQDAPVHEIDIRPDDPVREAGKDPSGAAELVVFSDFQCPSCQRFAAFLDARVIPLFDGGLRVIFKHYPLDQACNPATSSRLHRQACRAAAIAEAARVLGGNDAFWRAHDALFERHQQLTRGELSAADVASAIGLDPGRLQAALHSEAILARIRDDAVAARSCGVRGTPTVFFNRRRVDVLARSQIAFWQRIAELVRQGRGSTATQ